MEEKPRTIYFTDDPDTGIVHPDFIPDEDLAETGASVIAVLGISLILLVAIAILFCSMYFK